MPFHNPIRLAEDIATVDVISGGRFELGVGIGFKREEFSGFGVSSKERGARTDQSLEIIRRALAGEMVTFKSDFFDFQNIKVTPEPIQKPHPPIWLGGFTPAAGQLDWPASAPPPSRPAGRLIPAPPAEARCASTSLRTFPGVNYKPN